jgi:hypothetical protein
MTDLAVLNLPSYDFKIDSNTIFDPIRKKWVALTPEEWVRQNFLSYLMFEKKYPKSLIHTEETIQSFNKTKRCDAVIYSREIKPLLIVECKAPNIQINNKTFRQIAVYNASVKAPFLIVTNGLEHYCCQINFKNNSFSFLDEIPDYSKLAG